VAREIRPDQIYLDKLLKLIPSEIIAAYLFIQNLIANQPVVIGNTDYQIIVLWLVVFVFMIITPVYLVNVQHVYKMNQIVISGTAFLIWAYSLGGPFRLEGWYNPQIAAVLLVLWTLITPLFVKTTPARKPKSNK
jgi:hypothetical protein